MRNRWASLHEALKKWLGSVATSREQAQIYYEMLAVAPLLVVGLVPSILAEKRALR